jgi:hypothetical protein
MGYKLNAMDFQQFPQSLIHDSIEAPEAPPSGILNPDF